MKRPRFILLSIALAAFWAPADSQAQAGTGYPTSMTGCPNCCTTALDPQTLARLIVHPPDLQARITKSNVWIFDISRQQRKLVEFDSTPPANSCYEMYFHIPISYLQEKCGPKVRPQELTVKYDFQGSGTSTDRNENKFGSYGSDGKSVLQFLGASIVSPRAQLPLHFYRVPLPHGASKGAPIPSRKHLLLLDPGSDFVAGNMLELHAIGFKGVYIGISCSYSK